jgi:hypothetical protein
MNKNKTHGCNKYLFNIYFHNMGGTPLAAHRLRITAVASAAAVNMLYALGVLNYYTV